MSERSRIAGFAGKTGGAQPENCFGTDAERECGTKGRKHRRNGQHTLEPALDSRKRTQVGQWQRYRSRLPFPSPYMSLDGSMWIRCDYDVKYPAPKEKPGIFSLCQVENG